MNQNELYDAVKRCGFKVIQFNDNPNFFSSWSITAYKDKHNYLIEHEGRDGWLIFYREKAPNTFEELDKKTSHAMSDHEKINQCEAWLLTIN